MASEHFFDTILSFIPIPKHCIEENGFRFTYFSRGGKPFEVDDRRKLASERRSKLSEYKGILKAMKLLHIVLNPKEKQEVKEAVDMWGIAYDKVYESRGTPRVGLATQQYLREADHVIHLLESKFPPKPKNFVSI